MPAPPAFASLKPWRNFLFALLDTAPGLTALAVICVLTPGAAEAGAIETRQIGVLTALGVAALGAWAGWRAGAPGAVLAPLALLFLPPETRSLAATAILAVSLVAAVSRASGSRHSRDDGSSLWLALWRGYGLALAVQILLRPTYLLPLALDRSHLLELVGFPLAAALVVGCLRRDFGEHPALLAAGSVALVGPGFGWHSLLVLAALALAPQLRPAAAPAEAWRRALALAALLAVCLVETRWGVLALTGALAAAFPTPLAGLALPALVAAAAAAVRLRGVEEALPLLAWAFACVPTWFFAQRAALPVRAGALALAAAGLLALPAPATSWAPSGNPIQTLAPALGLVALAPRAWEKAAPFQRAWSVGLLALASLLAAFPWLRPAPLDGLARCVDFSPAGFAVLAVAAAALALLAWPRAFSRVWPAVLTAALLAHVRPWEVRQTTPAATAATATWTGELSGVPREVSVVSQLANAAQLPKDTLVARLRARGSDGQRLDFPIRAGVETGEWAARRPPMRALDGGKAPAAWRSRFTDTGEIGQSYRSSFDLHSLAPPVTVEIARDPALPAAIVFEVFSVAWRL
jgi:hypothetical protein